VPIARPCLVALALVMAAGCVAAAKKEAPSLPAKALATVGAPPSSAAAAPAPAAAKDELNVLPADTRGDLLRKYLLAECQKCLDARREAVAKLETPAQVSEYIKHAHDTWLLCAGKLPEPLAPSARTVGTIEREGYRIEKVIYESRPNFHVTGNLYIPTTGKPPYPAVLVPCGHDKAAKAAAPYQSVSILLAMNGFVVLCYDPIGQGERMQTFNAKGESLIWGTTEHTLIDISARLVGRSMANYRIWDGMRSIDYLVGRPEVDPKRIGCTGNSGGGTMTAYLMNADPRIVAAAPSGYITSLERLFATLGPQDGEQNIPAQVLFGLDHADYLEMRAPKPTLVLAATKDFFDIGGTWTSFREAKRLYGILGFGERIDIFEYPDTHSFSKPRREAALRWMRRWLQGLDEPLTEPPLKLSTEQELQCTKTGQVVTDLKDTTAWDLNLAAARAAAPGRESFWKSESREKCLDHVRTGAGLPPILEKPAVRPAGVIQRDGYRIEKLTIERPGEVPVPALLFVPAADLSAKAASSAGAASAAAAGLAEGKRPAVLYVDSRGKAAEAGPGGRLEQLVRAGSVVLAIDVRGCGETAPVKVKGQWSDEYPILYLALGLARPMLSQRVDDVLAAMDVLAARPEVDAAKVSLIGVEAAGPVALHAAALDKRVAELTLERSIESWIDVVATPMGKGQLQLIVPNALATYDLPDLIRAMAPRPVHVLSPVDPTGKAKTLK